MSENYLRVRGEYGYQWYYSHGERELPPRARRIRKWPWRQCAGRGTTSACAENTARRLLARGPNRNYLRVRGEYRVGPSASISCPELPPRARRIQVKYHGHIMDRGTTSACAENTASRIPKYHMTWNYLRVRGEYCLAHCSMSFPMELPPRARRIQPVLPKNWFVQGTTSACAENTGLDHLANSIDRNYLRVRGEYQGHGILPGRWGNYLRVRGEYPKQCHKERLIRELPPRARRIRALVA